MEASRSVTLNNGEKIPIVGFGTFLCAKGEIGEAIKVAINTGYRHIDCAYVYGNEKEIGDALQELFKQNVVKREDLFITSKLSPSSMHSNDAIENALGETLSNLQVGYLDLYLVHLPIAVEKIDGVAHPKRLKGFGLQDVWRKMEDLQTKGLTKSIGVSNYNVQTLNDLLNYAKISPVVNQVERHPYFPQNELLDFCTQNKVFLTAYCSLGSRGFEQRTKDANVVDLVDNPVIKGIASQYGKTTAQVLLRWSVDTNVMCIPKSSNHSRIKENFDIFDFKLNEKDLQSINELGKVGLRMFASPFEISHAFY